MSRCGSTSFPEPHATSPLKRFRQDRPDGSGRRARRRRGFELVSTGGTAKALADAGLPVTNVSDITALPRNDGWPRQDAASARARRHPRRRNHPDDLDAATAHGIGLIDLVVVNLYPFVKTAARRRRRVRRPHRADRHRRPEHGARGREEFSRRARRRRPGGLRRRARGARRHGRADAGVPIRARPQGLRTYRGVRHRDRDDARRG